MHFISCIILIYFMDLSCPWILSVKLAVLANSGTGMCIDVHRPCHRQHVQMHVYTACLHSCQPFPVRYCFLRPYQLMKKTHLEEFTDNSGRTCFVADVKAVVGASDWKVWATSSLNFHSPGGPSEEGQTS